MINYKITYLSIFFNILLIGLILYSGTAIAKTKQFSNREEACKKSNNIYSNNPDFFNKWVKKIKYKLKKKYNNKLIDSLFDKIPYSRCVVYLDNNQPELTFTFQKYIDLTFNSTKVQKGLKKLQQYKKELKKIEQKYKVPGELILSLWGIETYYGKWSGKFDVISSLATLASKGRRSSFFSTQLNELIYMLDSRNYKVNKLKGSWAGAMGHFQFIPQTFKTNSADGDGNGIKNIHNLLDGMHSAAKYLKKRGWNIKYNLGYQVVLSKNNQKITKQLSGKKNKRSAIFWCNLGIVEYYSKKCLSKNQLGSFSNLLMPDGVNGAIFLVNNNNLKSILSWNNSIFYALLTMQFMNQFSGKPTIQF